MAGRKKKNIPPVGEMRQSQIVNTFGPGALVDLPDDSVIIGGLDSWHGDMREITEERLRAELSQVLGRAITLREPPHQDGSTANRQARGIRVFRFPTWYVAQLEETYEDPATKKNYRTRPLVRDFHLHRGKYQDDNRKKHAVVPVRFVQACTRGHVADVDWYSFVLDTPNAPTKGALWLDEGGAANDFHEIYIRLVQGDKTVARRRLADAATPGKFALGKCSGFAPWLGMKEKQACGEFSRLLQRGATHAYFVQKRSVISIPDASRAIKEAVGAVFDDYFRNADDIEDVRYNRRKQPKVTAALEGYSDEQVWAEIQRRQRGATADATPKWRDYKREEIETFCRPAHGERIDEPDFVARVLPREQIPARYRDSFERVVLVENLREVVAQYGFTRFDDGVTDITIGDPSPAVQPAWLAREPTWCPAIENRGEGFFIGFSDDAIHAWLEGREGIGRRRDRFGRGFQAWVKSRNLEEARLEFPGLEHVMVHSFSHLLLTAVALECGYGSSSIRERIYAGPAGYGVLLYTASPGAEGTLGGLIEVGRNLERHLDRAMELGQLCSNDPICAQHDPADAREERYRHGAACHGCLLIAETSCEWRNEYLDRSLVVPTVESLGCEMFEGL